MKSKSIVITIIGITVISCVILFSFYSNNKNTASSKDVIFTSIVLKDQSFYAFIPEKYFKKEFTLSDANGHNVTPDFEWQDKTILKIKSLDEGSYTLTIPKASGSQSKKIKFNVKDIPEQAQNKQQLQDYFQSVKELKAVLAAPFAINNSGFFTSMDEDLMVSEESVKDAASGNEPTSNANHSTTNNQVAGIEEGDIAVTNGEYIFTARDSNVLIVKSKPLEQIGKISLSNNIYIEKLFMYKNLLIVQYVDYLNATEKSTVQIYNVEDPNKAEVLHTFAQEGYTMDSRISEDQLYLLSSYYVLEENETVPTTSTNGDDSLIETKDIYIYPYTMSEEYTVISKMNLSNFSVETKAFLGAGGNLYMSENAIYIAAVQWQPMPFIQTIEPVESTTVDRAMPVWNQPEETTIIKYVISNEIKKVAETKIKGTLLNQFSMDEHKGYFRVATTAGNASINNTDRNSENLLYILDENLKEVGKIDNLARGERIYSARFMGEKAYIVTFVETDPLFVLNLQDPSNPIVEGELKIPGYSNYLHPIGENHLLGIGHDTAIRNDGKNKFVENLGVKLSLFNVTDPSNPTEQDVEIIGGAGTTSSVNYSHKSLYRDLTNHIYGFDISVYNNYMYEGTGAAFYEITPTGIESRQLHVEKAAGEQYEDWNKIVQRILYVNDRTFLISNGEMKAFDRITLQPIEAIKIN